MSAVDAEAFPPGHWHGRWIWAADPDGPEGARTVVALRRDFQLTTLPERAPARIAAISGYLLLVNGREAARGPLRANPLRRPYDVVDLAPHLQVGANAIALLAWRYAQALPWWMPLPDHDHELARGAMAFEAWLGNERLGSDRSWAVLRLDWWTMTPPQGISGRGMETLDAAAPPSGWLRPGGASGWPAAVERLPRLPGEPARAEPPTHPIGPIEARPLVWPVPKAVALTPSGDNVWTAGQVVAGTVRFEVDGPARTSVQVQVAERLDDSGRPAPGEHDAAFEVLCAGERRVVETIDAYGLAAVAITAGAGATVTRVEVVERLHPVTGDAFFRCSDERLDRIGAVGRRTVSLCSWDAYLDCPTREQRAWTGDFVVHQMVDLATNADWGLARWHPRMSASPRADGMLPAAAAGDLEHADRFVIPDWALHWVHSVWNLYRYVGDREEIASLLPTAEGVLRWFARFAGPDGLLDGVLGAVLIDWASVYVDGASAALCGLWGRALLEFATMAEWLGDAGRASWARGCHARLAAGFERLWDAERGRYADVARDGARQPMASQHGQAAAIVGGLVPRHRWPRLVQVMTDEAQLVHAAFSAADGPALPNSEVEVGGAFVFEGAPSPWWDVERQVVRAQPFFRYVVHDALVEAGRADLIAAACLDWTVALERCPTSLSETWYGGTTCHGWSAAPTRDLTTAVLGIQPAAPGFASARIDPALGILDWAAGSAPTPFGPIHVEAHRSRLVVDSPVPFEHRGVHHAAGAHTLLLADQ